MYRIASSAISNREAHIKVALTLFDLLNGCTHRIASELTEREVTSILRKVESTLQFLIESRER
jgi:hypothetical protein